MGHRSNVVGTIVAVQTLGGTKVDWLPTRMGLTCRRALFLVMLALPHTHEAASKEDFGQDFEGIQFFQTADAAAHQFWSHRLQQQQLRQQQQQRLEGLGAPPRLPEEIGIAALEGDIAKVHSWLAGGGFIETMSRQSPERATLVPDGTLLHWASWNCEVRTAQWLLSNGAFVDTRDGLGRNALIIATYRGVGHAVQRANHLGIANSPMVSNCDRLVEILLQHGSDVDLQTYDGRTALAVAAARSSLAFVKKLLKAHAQNIEDSEGYVAVDYARLNDEFDSDNDSVSELLKHHFKTFQGTSSLTFENFFRVRHIVKMMRGLPTPNRDSDILKVLSLAPAPVKAFFDMLDGNEFPSVGIKKPPTAEVADSTSNPAVHVTLLLMVALVIGLLLWQIDLLPRFASGAQRSVSGQEGVRGIRSRRRKGRHKPNKEHADAAAKAKAEKEAAAATTKAQAQATGQAEEEAAAAKAQKAAAAARAKEAAAAARAQEVAAAAKAQEVAAAKALTEAAAAKAQEVAAAAKAQEVAAAARGKEAAAAARAQKVAAAQAQEVAAAKALTEAAAAKAQEVAAATSKAQEVAAAAKAQVAAAAAKAQEVAAAAKAQVAAATAKAQKAAAAAKAQKAAAAAKAQEEVVPVSGSAVVMCDGSDCVICMEKPYTITFSPCFHRCCCHSCANELSNCPICREQILHMGVTRDC